MIAMTNILCCPAIDYNMICESNLAAKQHFRLGHVKVIFNHFILPNESLHILYINMR